MLSGGNEISPQIRSQIDRFHLQWAFLAVCVLNDDSAIINWICTCLTNRRIWNSTKHRQTFCPRCSFLFRFTGWAIFMSYLLSYFLSQINFVTFPLPQSAPEQELLKPKEWSYCDYFWVRSWGRWEGVVCLTYPLLSVTSTQHYSFIMNECIAAEVSK